MATGKSKVKDSIEKRFPEWSAFIEQFTRKQSIQRLKVIVRQMWFYFRDESLSRVANPFHCFVAHSELEFVRLLVDCGIDLTMTDPHGMTSMHYACAFGNVEMVELCLKHVPSFNATLRTNKGRTIFHLAARNRDTQVLKLILNTFRYEDITDHQGWTMIHFAVAFGPKETIKFLLESRQKIGFNLEARLNKGCTILHVAFQKRDIEIVDLVFEALEEIHSEIDFDARTNIQATPLHYACINPESNTAIQLLQKIPEKINVLGQNDAHLLHYACKAGHLKLLKYIMENPAIDIDYNVVTLGIQTPLHVACGHGQFEVVKLLLDHSQEKKIDFNKIDQVGNTPLHLACYNGHRDTIKLLLDNAEFKGINVKARNVNNQTAEDLAKLEGHLDVLQLLHYCIAFPKIKETKGVTKKKK